MPLSASRRIEIDIRRQIEKRLFVFGLSIMDVANALGIDQGSASNDYEKLGGKGAFGDFSQVHPAERRAEAYGAALKEYALMSRRGRDQELEPEVRQGLLMALESYLNLRKLGGAASGLAAAVMLQLSPIEPKEHLPYRLLARALFGSHGYGDQITGDNLLRWYLQDLVEGNGPMPARESILGDMAAWSHAFFEEKFVTPFGEPGIRGMEEAIRTLQEREQDVIRKRFGIGCDRMTHDDIGRVHLVHRERIRQIEAAALRKLRHPDRTGRLRMFMRSPAENARMLAEKWFPVTPPTPDEAMDDLFSRSTEELELSVRAYNILKFGGIMTLRQLVVLTESEYYRRLKGGRKSFNETREVLESMGLRFGMRFDEAGRPIEASSNDGSQREDDVPGDKTG